MLKFVLPVAVPAAVGFLLLGAAGSAAADHHEKDAMPKDAKTYTNPVYPNGEDPWVTKRDGMYYYVFATGPNHTGERSQKNAVWVTGADALTEVFAAEQHAAWEPEAGTMYSEELWAPELHWFDGAWYIYVAADDGNNDNHKMHVLKREDDDPRGEYEHLGELKLPDNKWAIDGTLADIDGELYYVWSGWPGDKNETQNLYICRMKDPFTAVGERVMISKPELDWELGGGGPGLPTINEGPTIVSNGGKTFCFYAASGSWSDFYCVGLLELTGDDPMDSKAWTKHGQPFLASGEGRIAPGHPSVTTSPDDSQWWLVYHTAKHPGAGWDREINLQQFRFDEDTGRPVIDELAGQGKEMSAPSSE